MGFTDDQKEQIKNAVAKLEANTAGELVPFFVKKSSSYVEARWLGSLLFSANVVIYAAVMHFIHLELNVMTILYLFVGSGFLGWFTPYFFPATIRIILSGNYLAKIIHQRASTAFVDEEVFNTVDRIGILIFISEMERKVVVVADKGIDKVVDKESWAQVVNTVLQGASKEDLPSGIVAAIQLCEKVLIDHGFINRVKPSNEISDELRGDL